MEKAREELLRLIGEIGSHMKTVFSKQFALINQYFGETFSEIFGGGTAALELTDPSEVLSSGIEIKVMLPGKTLKTIWIYRICAFGKPHIQWIRFISITVTRKIRYIVRTVDSL